MEAFSTHAYDGQTMIRFVFRFVGLLSACAGFIFLVYDGTRSIADQTLNLTSVGPLVEHPPEFATALQPAVERHVALWLGRA